MADIPELQTTQEGRDYEKEIMQILSGEKKDYPSYFGGLKVASGNEFRIQSPIDESIDYGIFQEPEEGIMETAVTAALKAFGGWSKVPVQQRAAYFVPVLETLKARRLHFAADVTVATGMVRQDALNEVDSCIEMIAKAIEEAPSIGTKRPVGVWAVLSAHNSPFATPVASAVAAMIAGNTVIMNPCKECPTPIYHFYSIVEKQDLPGGVLNLIVDRKDGSTELLANDMRVSGIVASGSGDRLEDLMFLQVDDELKFINEIKGMNPAIVYRPSDMKAAVRDIVESAFAYSGQRLFSCSKVIITADDQGKFMDILSEYMKDLKVDDPVNDTTFTGPVIGKDAVKRFKAIMEDVAPFVVAKGAPVCGLPDNYVAPVAVSGLDIDNDLNFMDSGLPILNITVVEDMDRAFEELEDTECGLSAGLFSKDARIQERFRKECEAPQTYINCSSRSLRPARDAVLTNFVR